MFCSEERETKDVELVLNYRIVNSALLSTFMGKKVFGVIQN